MIVLDVQTEEVIKAMRSLADPKWDKEVKKGFLNIAKVVRDEIKSKVPKGQPKERSWMTLRRGVVAKAYDRQYPHNPAVFVGVDYKVAPHFHLIEFGWYHTGHEPNKVVGAFVPGKHIFAETVYRNQEKIVSEMEDITLRIVHIAWEAG